MNDAFEKILDRFVELKERYERLEYWSGNSCEIEKYIGMQQTIVSVIEIVQEVAEEYKDGWIPCSERLPESHNITDDFECPEYNVTIKGAKESTTLKYSSDKTWFDENGNCYEVIAWQPLPDTYNDNK